MIIFDRVRRTLKPALTGAVTLAILATCQPIVIAHANTSAANAIDPIVINQTSSNGVPLITQQANNPPAIVSQAAVVMDMTTGTIVYAKNPQVSHYPASLTKMLTALVALDKGKLTDELTVSKLATEQPPDKLYLVPGEQEPFGKLLYGMLLNSANDAAVVIAQNYGGSIQGFAKLMNEKAAELGATHTHFDNPTGLPNPSHVTTAYDLAIIARAAMANPVFRKVVATKHFDWQGQAWHRNLININSMLFTYPGAIGVKTGYTDAAHETLAVAATRGNQTYLAILMDAPLASEINSDATSLLNFAFGHYQTETLLTGGTKVGTLTEANGQRLPVRASRSVLATVENGHSIKLQQKVVYNKNWNAQTGNGATVGRLELMQGGNIVATDPVLANMPPVANRVTTLSRHTLLWKLLGAVGVLVFILFVLRTTVRIRRARMRRRRYGSRSGLRKTSDGFHLPTDFSSWK